MLAQAIVRLRPNVELISAMTASAGFELARERSPDLILLDMHLPDASGDLVPASSNACVAGYIPCSATWTSAYFTPTSRRFTDRGRCSWFCRVAPDRVCTYVELTGRWAS